MFYQLFESILKINQGPLKEKVEDFWRMVCQYKVEAIVMLTRCVEMGKVSKPHPHHKLSEPSSTTHHSIIAAKVSAVLARQT